MMKQQLRSIRYFVDVFKQAFGKYRFQIVILTFLGFLSGVFEGIGVNSEYH